MPDAKDAKPLYNDKGESRVTYTEAEERKARAEGFTKSYTFQEYPKSLHKDGDRLQPERVVRDSDAEKAARAEGFRMIGEKAPEPEAPADKLADKKAKK
jgi:hypothetical protein